MQYIAYQRQKWEGARRATPAQYGRAQMQAMGYDLPAVDTAPKLPRTAPSGRTRGRHAGTEDLREMLLEAGVGDFNALMAIEYMFFLPPTSDPYAQGVILIIEGLQNLLNARGGASIRVDGTMGPETVRALRRFAGPAWYDKTWAQLYGDVLRAKPWSGFVREGRRQEGLRAAGWPAESPLGTTLLGDLVASPLPLLLGAAGVYWFLIRKRG